MRMGSMSAPKRKTVAAESGTATHQSAGPSSSTTRRYWTKLPIM
jgi:hypothetical protein